MNVQTRIKTLIAIGLLPQDAASIVTNESVQDTKDTLVSDVLHAATYLRYGNLLPDEFKGLWDASLLNVPQVG